MRSYLMIVGLAMAAPAAAEECTFDLETANASFSTALKAIFDHQGFAWACAPYIGDDLARSGVVHIETLLEDTGISSNDATIRADEMNAKAKAAGETNNMVQQLKAINATRQEAMIACSQIMDEEFQKFRVSRAKMLKARCQ